MAATMSSARKSPAGKGRRDRGAGAATVNIRVRNLTQMFNSLDPSPFWDRDLDQHAAEFIEEEFSDKRGARRWRLRVHASEGAALAPDVRSAVARYYQRLASSARRRQREQTRLGQLALLGGALIFLLAMSVREILAKLLPHGTSMLIDEGLIILAWLALWRPTESLVYGWVPLFRQRRLYERLAAMSVSVRVDDGASGVERTPPAQDISAADRAAPPAAR